ncbi:hypothetical protein N9I77_00835 [Cyclobacteriaceae bacterium]|nr:hypothetical protein [Cyclobacteriaceae bacterium]
MRRIVLYFNGFLIPLGLTFCFFYWHGNGFHAWHALVERGLFGQQVKYLSEIENFYFFGIPIVIGLVAMASTFFSGHFSSFQNKSAQAMLFMMLGATIVIWVDVETSPAQMLYLVPSISFFLVHYLLKLRKRWAKRWVPLMILGVLILAPYLSYIQLDMDTIRVKEPTDRFSKRRTMLLGDNLSVLNYHELSSPFLDAQLSKERIELLDEEASAQALLRIIEEAPPAVIIDDWSVIPNLFSRLPELSKKYRKQRAGYYVRISN